MRLSADAVLDALKPGRWYARHYTYNDLARALPFAGERAIRTHTGRLKAQGLVVVEPWGPFKVTFRRADAPVCEATRRFVEGWNYSTYHNSWCRKERPGLTITDAERDLGLKTSALSRWLVNYDLHVLLPKRGKYRYVFDAVLEHYLEQTERKGVERVNVRPDGYVGIYRAADMLAADKSVVWRAAQRGDVHAVRTGHTHYYSRYDLEALAWALKDTPLPGYEAIRDRCKALDADRTACSDWLRNHGYEIKQFRAPDKQLTNYALTRDLDIWQERYTGSCRKLTQAQARDIRRRHNTGESVPDLARAFGVQNGTVRQIVLGKTYRESQLEQAAWQ